MGDLMMEFPDTVSDARGTFRAWVMARQSDNGEWEGWLEFVPTDHDTSAVYATPIETRQCDRTTVALWASGLNHVHAGDALARATLQQGPRAAAQLLFSLEELVQAIDRRIPQTGRIGEAAITVDASRLRACAMQRLALLRRLSRTPAS